MPTKIRKAIGAVKDQTSISLAKVSSKNASALQVAILKATSHDEGTMDERYVEEILSLVSSRKYYAAACARIIGKRIGKTRNWIVALKSLMLVLRIFQDGDPYFPKEVLREMRNGTKILNLASFRDDSNSSPWDYTSFVRTFALYLDDRLNCIITGKLQRRICHSEGETKPCRRKETAGPIYEMKPTMLLDKISFWQRLLDRAIGTRPTGSANNNRLVKISLNAIVQESFDLYRDISDGLAVLLDSFFHLQYHSSVTAFQNCIKATHQFDELRSFYDMCKSLGVGTTSEYPSVQKISDELLETLQEFLKDQSSFPVTSRSPQLLLPAPQGCKDPCSSFERGEAQSECECGSQCTSWEDVISRTEGGSSPGLSVFSDFFDDQSQTEDFASTNDSESSHLFKADQRNSPSGDFLCFNDWTVEEQKQDQGLSNSPNGDIMLQHPSREGWEIVLSGLATEPVQEATQNLANISSQSVSMQQSSEDQGLGVSLGNGIGNGFGQQSSEGWELMVYRLETESMQPSQNLANEIELVSGSSQSMHEQGVGNEYEQHSRMGWEVMFDDHATQLVQQPSRNISNLSGQLVQEPALEASPTRGCDNDFEQHSKDGLEIMLMAPKPQPTQSQNLANQATMATSQSMHQPQGSTVRYDWELLFSDTGTQLTQPLPNVTNHYKSRTDNDTFDQAFHNNPFLEDPIELSTAIVSAPMFATSPSFQTDSPTFCAQSANQDTGSLGGINDDPFAALQCGSNPLASSLV